MERLCKRTIQKVSGEAWNDGRDKFFQLSQTLLSPDKQSIGILTTIYVKFQLDESAGSPVYAVVWIKNSKKWVIGLSLEEVPETLGPAPPKKKYNGLSGYFNFNPEDELPDELPEWANLAHSFAKKQLNDQR